MMGEDGALVKPLGALALLLLSGTLVWNAGPAREGLWPGSSPHEDVVVEATGDRLTVSGLSAARVRALKRRHARDPGAIRLQAGDVAHPDPTFPSVAGRIEGSDGDLAFVPRYRLAPGPYTLVVAGADGRDPLEFAVSVPPASLPDPPRVDAVFPAVATIPANQLKLYVYFSRPMRTWDPYRHVRLVDSATGHVQEGVFHAMRDGLWDAAGTRLTLVFDPGRIKRGLTNRETFGTPLEPGRDYRLIIGGGFVDAAGDELGSPFEQAFRVTAEDRQRPDPRRWALAPPAAGTTDPLIVEFGEALDHALAGRGLAVGAASGWRVEGDGELVDGDRAWRFRPLRAWPPGPYELLVDPQVEDLAGNSVNRLFDIDRAVDGAGQRFPTGDRVRIPFSVERVEPLTGQ